MLLGISPLFSPELLAVLDRMGHGDEVVLAFCACRMVRMTHQADYPLAEGATPKRVSVSTAFAAVRKTIFQEIPASRFCFDGA